MTVVDYVLANLEVFLGVPIIGAAIGWVTNYVAVKMLFHPKEPLNLGLVSVQGVFPKRQQAFAQRLGELVSEQLVSTNDLVTILKQVSDSDRISKVIDAHIEDAITKKLPQAIPMLAMVLNPQLVQTVKGVILKDLDGLISEILSEVSGHVQDVLDVKKLVEQKVAAFSSDRLEEVVFAIMSKELRFIEKVGGVLGFLIGVVQVLLVKGGEIWRLL